MAAGEEWNRDLILADFQAASGVDDLETCISILESNSWDLQTSLNAVFSDERNGAVEIVENPPRPISQHVDFSTTTATQTTHPPVINIDDDPRFLIFHILWEDHSVPVTINDNQTIGELKKLIEQHVDRSLQNVDLEGWPSGNNSLSNETFLSTLNLSAETHLVLPSTSSKVTVTPAKFRPCNAPPVYNGEIKKRNKEKKKEDVSIIDRDVATSSGSSGFNISLIINDGTRDYKLRYNGNQSVKEVKQKLNILTGVPPNRQQWMGWPEGTTDQMKLKDLDLSEDHFLICLPSNPSDEYVREVVDQTRNLTNIVQRMDEDENVISDDEADEIDIDDDMDLSGFDEQRTSKKITPLLPACSNDDFDSMIRFQSNFEERYGDLHPPFFLGPLKNAIDEASGEIVEERKPLLIYLHHDSSILSNVFCSQIICSETFAAYVSQNFVIWPWDVSHESNKQRFIHLLTEHFGNSASSTITQFKNSMYPLLIIVMKSQAGLEVCSVLQGSASLENLMTSLINGYEVFEQTKIVEVKAENERRARELVKQEQDDAYLKSLAADKAKQDEEAKREIEEKKRKEKIKLQEEIKEAQRISCEEHVPDEPPKGSKNITTIRFRCPGGQLDVRRFDESNKFKMVMMYVASKGYNLNDHRIVSTFPRKQFTDEDALMTLKELKLCPQVQLFIEEL